MIFANIAIDFPFRQSYNRNEMRKREVFTSTLQLISGDHKNMKMTFRWYGEKDSIPLQYIKQIPNMSGVVTAVYDIPVGQVWDESKILLAENTVRRSGTRNGSHRVRACA